MLSSLKRLSTVYDFLAVTSPQLKEIGNLLLTNKDFVELDEINAKVFFNNISRCCSLRMLHLNGNFSNLHADVFIELGKAISRLDNFTLCLNIGDLDAFNKDSFLAFSNMLLQCPGLKTLDFSESRIGELDRQHFEILFNILLQCKGLEVVDFSSNNLGKLDTDCFNILCYTLPKFENLQVLKLCNNDFNNLDDNFSEVDCFGVLREALFLCSKLNRLYLSSELSTEQQQQLQRMLEMRSKLFIEDKEKVKTILLCFNRLLKPKPWLIDSYKSISTKILHIAGYVHPILPDGVDSFELRRRSLKLIYK